MGVTTVIKDYGTDILNAIRENDLQRLRQIVEKNLRPDSKIQKLCVSDIKHKPTKKFACPLILAARQEDPKIMRWMMEKGVDPNFIHHTIFSSKRKEIVTALHIAVDLGHYDTVQVLLDANADPNIGDHNHETPLHIATKKADKVMVRMLLSKGADPSIPDRKGNAALHIATLYGHLQLVRSLLKYDADVYQKGQWGTIPPHIAAKEGHIHLIQLFCSRDVGNINIKIPCYPDKREKAPIHLAAENGHVETVLALLDQFDADANQKDSDGNTPLHCVVLNQYNPHRMRDKEYFNETARVLLKYRTSINEKNIYGDTALHLAAMNQFQRIVELLLAIGANPFAENDEHLKPIDVVPDFDPVTKQILKNAMLNPKQPLSASLASFRNELDLTPASSQLYIHRPRKYSDNGLIDDHVGGRGREMRHHNMSYVSQSTLCQSMDSVFDDYPSKPRPRSASQGRDPGRRRAMQRGGRQPQPQPSPTQQRRQQNRQEQDHRARQRPHSQYDDDYDPLYDDVENQPEPMFAKPEKKPKPKQVSSSSIQTDTHKMKTAATQHEEDDDISLTSSRDGSIQTVSTGIPDASAMNAELKRIIQEQRKQLQAYEEKEYSELGSVLDYSAVASEKPYHPLALKKDRPRPSPRSSTRSAISMRPIPAERSHTPSSMGSRSSPTFHENIRNQQQTSHQGQQDSKGTQQQSHYQNAEAIRVNHVPGKPGTIEVSYGGGPISISVDPQSMQYHIQRQEEEGNQERAVDDPQRQHDQEYDPDRRHVDPPRYNQRHQHQDPSRYDDSQRRPDQHGHSPQYQGSNSYAADYSEDYNGFYDSTEMESQQSYSVHSTDREMVTDAIKHSVFEVMGHRTLESAQDSYNESPNQQGVEKPQPRTKPVAQKRSKTPTREQKSEGLSLPPELQQFELQPSPPQAMNVARADGSVSHEDDVEPSPDTTPNTSPQYKSFSQKMAMFKEQETRSLENTPEKPRKPAQRNLQREERSLETPPEAGARWGQTQREQRSQVQDETQIVATPEVSQWKVESGETAVVEHTDIQEYEGSPSALRRAKRMDYTSQTTDRDSQYMASAQINSSYGEEDSESDEEEAAEPTPALIKASQHPYESHDQYYSITGEVDMNSEPSSAAQTPSKTPRTAPNQVSQIVRATNVSQRIATTTTQKELSTVTEPYKVSSEPPQSDSGVQSSTEQGQTAVEQLYEYEEEPGSRRLNITRHKVVSPVTIEISPPKDELRSAGAKTPDSLFSDSDSRRSGSLNMRVTGEVPKAYKKGQKPSARKAFMLAKPEGIESCSEGSDIEGGSLSRLSRRGMSESSDRWSKYSETGTPTKDSAPSEVEKQEEIPPNPALKLRGPLPKPYKSFGEIKVETYALDEAMEENAAEEEHRARLEASMAIDDGETSGARVGYWVQQAEPTQVSTENLAVEDTFTESGEYKPQVANVGEQPSTEQGKVGVPSQIAQITSEIHYIDSDESDQQTKRVPGVRSRQAGTSLSEGSFKKNLKMSEPTAESYHTVVAEQQVAAIETVTTDTVKSNIAPQAEIVELDTDMNTSKSSTDFDEDREALAYGKGPKVIAEGPDIHRPPKPKLIGDQPRRNRHSIESEVETIPIDPEFIIEEPKKKKPPRPRVIHPIPDNKSSNQGPCPVAQQVTSNFTQQTKSSNQGKTGRITPKTSLAVLDTLEEQSESDISEYYDQEPSRRMPKEKGKSTEKQITNPEATGVQGVAIEQDVRLPSDNVTVDEPQEFENFGRGIQNRSSGIEAEQQKRKSQTEPIGDENQYLESYEREPGARKWGRHKESVAPGKTPDEDAAELHSTKPDHPTRHVNRPLERPPSPPQQQQLEAPIEIESYDDEPGARRRRPNIAREQPHQEQVPTKLEETSMNIQQAQQQHVDVDVRGEENKEEISSSEDDEVAQISAAADERRKQKQAKKRAAMLAEQQKLEAEAVNKSTSEDDEFARQAAIHQEMIERKRLAQIAQEQALLDMNQYVDAQRAAGSEQPQPAVTERVKGRRQMGGPQGRHHQRQQQQQQQPQQQQPQQQYDQQGYPYSNQQYAPGYDSNYDPSHHGQSEAGENQPVAPTAQKIPSHLLAEPEKKKKGGFFGFGSSRKKKDRPERSSESSTGGKSDGEYKSDGETKKKKKGLFGRRKDTDTDTSNVAGPQVAILPGQQVRSTGQPVREKPIDVGGPANQQMHAPIQVNVVTPEMTTPEVSPGTPQTPHGILGTVMGSNLERSDTVRESGRKAGFFSKRKDKKSDDGQYGAVPYVEDEAAEEGSSVKQTIQYVDQQHDQIHDHGRGIIPHEQQLRQGYDQQHHHGYPEHQTVSSQPGYDVQQGQQSFQEAAFSSVTAVLDSQRRYQVQEDSRRQFTHPSGQQTLQQHERTHPGETNLDDEIGQEQLSHGHEELPHQPHGRIHVQGKRYSQGKDASADLAAQLWSQQHGPPQMYKDQESSKMENFDDRSRSQQAEDVTYGGQQNRRWGPRSQQAAQSGHPPRQEYETGYLGDGVDPHGVGQRGAASRHQHGQPLKQEDTERQIVDDPENVSKLWKERGERESEMQRLLMSMAGEEIAGQPEEVFYKDDETPRQAIQQEGAARWCKSRGQDSQGQQQTHLIGQPAMGVAQQYEDQRFFQEAAFSSVTSSIQDQKRSRMEEEARGRKKQAPSSQHISNAPETGSPIRRPKAVYGSPMHDARRDPQKSMADDEAAIAGMWGSQHRPDPNWLQQQGVNAANRAQTEVVVMDYEGGQQQLQQQQQQSQEPFQRGRWGASRRSKPKRPANSQKDSGAVSDSEAFSKRKSAKSISFEDNLNDDFNIHSETEMFDMEGPKNKAEASRTLQEVAMDTLTTELNYQPKLKPRRPVWEQTEDRPINYTRGVYRPKEPKSYTTRQRPIEGESSSSRYDDSALVGKMWSASKAQVESDSEADADTEDINLDTSRGNSMTRGSVSGIPNPHHPGASRQYIPEQHQAKRSQHPSAFSPVSAGAKKVKIVESKRKKKKDKAPRITEPGPVDFSQYDMIAKLWMEKVDKKTVQKSKTMKLAVLPEGQAPPSRITDKLSYQMTSDDVFLPPQWVIARGRSLRKIKHLASSSSLGAQRTSSSALNDSDYELSDRPFSPGRQMVLFFKVGSNWKDLAWVLFEGILSDSETIRMIKDIQLKHPGQLTDQVHDLMKRWWAKRGPAATIEELYVAMDIINLGYIKEEHFDDRTTSVTSYTDTEDELDISEIDEADPDVSRLMTEYHARSLNASFECDIPPENRGSMYGTGSTNNIGSPGFSSVSADNILQRMDQRGILPPRTGSVGSRGTLDASRNTLDVSRDNLTGRRSPGYGNGRRSPYSTGRRSPDPLHNSSYRYDPSQEDYSLDDDGRQRFLIVQPQLRQNDYRHETAI